MKENIKPLVSIIAVCHNHINFISDCINSIVKQSYNNTEVIVFDNSSTDGSSLVLKNLKEKYNFNLILQENIGLPATLNKAITIAKGKYISFISTDDYWPLDKIESQVTFMEAQKINVAGCGGNSLRIDESGKIFRKQSFSDEYIIDFERAFIYNENIPALTALYKREKLIEVGLYNTNCLIEDYCIILKLTKQNNIVVFRNELAGYYRHHETNISHNYNLFDTMFSVLSEYSEEKNYHLAVSNLYLKMFCKYAKLDRRLAVRYLKGVRVEHLFSKVFIKAVILMLLPRRISKNITNTI